jgi:hypothetical protein
MGLRNEVYSGDSISFFSVQAGEREGSQERKEKATQSRLWGCHLMENSWHWRPGRTSRGQLPCLHRDQCSIRSLSPLCCSLQYTWWWILWQQSVDAKTILRHYRVARITLSSEIILKLWLLLRFQPIVDLCMFVVSLGPCGIPRTYYLCGILCGVYLGSMWLVLVPMWLVTRMWDLWLVVAWRLVWDQNCLVQHVHQQSRRKALSRRASRASPYCQCERRRGEW